MAMETGGRRRSRPGGPLRVAFAVGTGIFAVALVLPGCTRQGEFQPVSMWNGSRVKPMEESPMPGTASSARVLPPGAIARGEAWQGDPAASGRSGGKLVTEFPVRITRATLQRGQERFNIYCSPCHGRLGNGEGMVARRGFPHPPDYAIRRLRDAPVGHFFDVVTNGYGVMYSYAARVPPNDRWAIAAYIRVLQASRPEVPLEKWEEERARARETGIGVRPTRQD
jgi:mono/diheme cytochrome c family protein